ncbi:hypothetical protein [Niveispirillum cyanobacteriorum]|uniref:hypothetical protein n=1 Tax=Niveispirillum cyanobacteriorum TaxID=1612173 RepID=UPI0018F81C08|nr:hypothetical protein [Niveispirillum cyanobacteriorum]
MIAAKSADPFFQKVLDSQKQWARRILSFENEYAVRTDLAFQHFFGAPTRLDQTMAAQGRGL